ncbi:MAG: sugar ABC transporter ATP-binding protein, partial [SAR324 cluster bacterium]|nr:sugar ABC transporter ATP-binding protein [SAR324 cluster bacterium]
MESESMVLNVRNLSKRFDMTQALEDVSMDMKAGEIHALVGENGAGKSTLIKILTGIQQADQGEVLLQGQSVRISDAQEAQSLGIAAIFQEPMVFPDLDVAENIFISHRDRGFFVRWKKIYQDAETILNDLGIQLDVRSPASGLTLAAQQAVEIAKAISLNVKVLIMDEPTASLSSHEVSQLFSVTRRLRDEGVAVLFISHRLEEVFEIADRITVFRDGHKISTNPVSEVTRESLIQEMVGREVSKFYQSSKKAVEGKQVCSIKNLNKKTVFSDINFDLHQGEILGFAGLVGSRRTDVGLAIFGVTPADSGSIEIEGQTEDIQ